MFKIYLAGAIEIHYGSEWPKKWREDCSLWFHEYCENVGIINPTIYYNYENNYSHTDSEVFRFDLYKLEKSDLVLVDLNDIRLSIGTSHEIFHAYYHCHIPVIGFHNLSMTEDEIKKKIHPWNYECCSRIETGTYGLEKAMEYIRDFYIN